MKNTVSYHIALAHNYWQRHLKKGDNVIDATCGNGKDALVLSNLVLHDDSGSITLFDIQKQSIETTRSLLLNNLSNKAANRTHFINSSHEELSSPYDNIALVVYNLGYLPGGDKSITTTTASTISSITSALPLLNSNGAISIMCYPGHGEGKKEEQAILSLTSSLPVSSYSSLFHQWINHNNAPSFFWIQKIPHK
jgi:hypothetical protein